jgi:hypothetical protein
MERSAPPPPSLCVFLPHLTLHPVFRCVCMCVCVCLPAGNSSYFALQTRKFYLTGHKPATAWVRNFTMYSTPLTPQVPPDDLSYLTTYAAVAVLAACALYPAFLAWAHFPVFAVHLVLPLVSYAPLPSASMSQVRPVANLQLHVPVLESAQRVHSMAHEPTRVHLRGLGLEHPVVHA